MKQLVQLQENLDSFNQAGIAVVAMTYDAPELQQAFIDAQGISYPFLSDIDATSVQALGILNTKYAPGENSYGIPYPGVFVVNTEGVIVGKIFVEGYSTRVDAAGVLAYAKEVLEIE
jgi:peroxiredoxin